MAISESESPYASVADRVSDLADLVALQMLMSAGANLTVADVDALDSITIRLLRQAEIQRDAVAADRFQRLRLALCHRFAPKTDSGH